MLLHAKKSLGQHFLNSPSVLRKIIDAAELKTGETVLEIGPGTGILTRALLDTGVKVIAVEKDVRAIAMLEQTFFKECASGQLILIDGDILDPKLFDTQKEAVLPTPDTEHGPVGMKNRPSLSALRHGNFSLIANIPYYITGAILEKFLEHGPRPDRIVILVQKEVAERIVARDDKESILSVSVKAFGMPKLVAVVPPGAFTPPPTVDSAILSITEISHARFGEEEDLGKKRSLEVRTKIDIQHFFRLVKAGFSHKRKFAIRNIETAEIAEASRVDAPVLTREKLERVWTELKIDSKVRAEDIPVGEWIEIARSIGRSRE